MAAKLRRLWPQPVADEKGYLEGLAYFLGRSSPRMRALICDPVNGIARHCPQPPTMRDLVDFEARFDFREPPRRGRNFTGAADRTPDPRQGTTGEDRMAIVVNALKRMPAAGRIERAAIEEPAEAEEPWWRKQGPPSDELAAQVQAHGEAVAKEARRRELADKPKCPNCNGDGIAETHAGYVDCARCAGLGVLM